MKLNRLFATIGSCLVCCYAFSNDDLNVGVTISGEITPGVYGRVEIGNNPPPPVIYSEPRLVVKTKERHEPIYLHVPPGHAMHWDKHCEEYHACNREVYFVRSSEYDDYIKKNKHGKHHGHDDNDDENDHDHGHGHGHKHD